MRESLLEILRCPVDRCPLELEATRTDPDGHVLEGTLRSARSDLRYPIRGGVPDMLPADGARVEGEDLSAVQDATADRFGWEWRHFRDWGWLAEYPDVPRAEERYYGGLAEHTASAFWGKTRFRKRDLGPENRVLDAGCGNGRFSRLAADTGARVVGVDLGAGVTSAFEHLRDAPNVEIVRGDLFRLPFADETFDRAFSIGVLQHTGNAARAYDSIARTLGREALFGVTVYGRGLWTYETLDASIRALTTRLPISWQLRFSRLLAGVAVRLRSGPERRQRLYWRIFRHLQLLPTEHHMFDWWSAPYASHHTLDEVRGWLRANGFELRASEPAAGDAEGERRARRNHASVTALGARGDHDA